MPGFWPTRLRDGWEYCFHLSKSKKPYIDQDSVRIPVGSWVKSRLQNLGVNDLSRQNSVNLSGFGRDISRWVGKTAVLPTNVINAALVGKNKGHPAVFPIELPIFFIKLLSRPGSLIIDPFGGSGTTGIAALQLNRNVLLVDNNKLYCQVAAERITKEAKVLPNSVISKLSAKTLKNTRLIKGKGRKSTTGDCRSSQAVALQASGKNQDDQNV